MSSRELRRILRRKGCTELRQRGSHLVVQCGHCQTVVPVHTGEDLGRVYCAQLNVSLSPASGRNGCADESKEELHGAVRA